MLALGVRNVNFGPRRREEDCRIIAVLPAEPFQHGLSRCVLQRSGGVHKAAVKEHATRQVCGRVTILDGDIDRAPRECCEVDPRERSSTVVDFGFDHAPARFIDSAVTSPPKLCEERRLSPPEQPDRTTYLALITCSFGKSVGLARGRVQARSGSRRSRSLRGRSWRRRGPLPGR